LIELLKLVNYYICYNNIVTYKIITKIIFCWANACAIIMW